MNETLQRVILGVLAERGECEDDDLHNAVQKLYETAGERFDLRTYEQVLECLCKAGRIRWRWDREWRELRIRLYRLAKQSYESKACAGQMELFQ